ncbi:DUF5047 domain-containing protein [Streptomyces sp. NPDC012794]|uniref:DUF5047 domain-containing protein n=1 Tax=Streptomyces sp. NPDC012794 TaxID=3364850 RepID=UPI0036C53C19
MYPVSDRFIAALAESHVVITKVILFRAAGGSETLDHSGGSVSVDLNSVARRTCSVTLADPALIPRTASDKASTYGARLRILRGVRYNDGAEELAPLGIFRLDEVSGDVDDGPVTLSGKSLEVIVSDDKFTAPYRASGTAVGAITALIHRSLPDAEINSSGAVDATIGARTWDIEADPWAAVLELGAAIGAEVFVDPEGVFTIAELPELLSTAPVWTVAAGEGGTYVKADRGMSLDGVYNGVLARGENTEEGVAPVSSLVVDSDPGSPTYWDGPLGHRPTFVTSPTLITTLQCTQAATLKLRSASASNATADVTCLPNAALAPGDVLRVLYPDGTSELHQVAAFDVPLSVEGLCTLRTISAQEDS